MKSEPRYELIFALDAPTAEALSKAASRSLTPGRFCRPNAICDQYYQIAPAESRSSKHKPPRSHYRVRQFDERFELQLQKMAWKGDICSVRQSTVSPSDFSVGKAEIANKKIAGGWFHKKIAKHQLKPRLQIQAELRTWRSDSNEGKAELTMESNIRARHLSDDLYCVPGITIPSCIVRMNFQTALPATFKRLIYEFSLLSERSTVLLEMAEKQLERQQRTEQNERQPKIAQQRQIIKIAAGTSPRTEVSSCRIG